DDSYQAYIEEWYEDQPEVHDLLSGTEVSSLEYVLPGRSPLAEEGPIFWQEAIIHLTAELQGILEGDYGVPSEIASRFAVSELGYIAPLPAPGDTQWVISGRARPCNGIWVRCPNGNSQYVCCRA